MMGRIRLAFLITAISLLSLIEFQPLLACRYNVRETGFVDFGIERFTLCLIVNQHTSAERIAEFSALAEGALSDSNVGFEVVNADQQKGHPVFEGIDGDGVSSYPLTVLMPPGGHSGSLLIEESAGLSADGLQGHYETVADSPLRQQLVQELARSYAVVLLVESHDIEANQKARRAIENAAHEIELQMEFMPKPIARGLFSITLKQERFASERVLLWSLGVKTGDWEEKGLSEPRVAVVYGRARRIGPVLKGEEIDRQVLVNILSIVGADCECGLDPRLIRGSALPVRWDKSVRTEVARELGFDPENPMVRMEVSQILKLRSTLYPYAHPASRGSEVSVDDLPVPFVEDRPSEGTNASGKSPLQNLSYLLAVLALGVVSVGIVLLVKTARNRF